MFIQVSLAVGCCSSAALFLCVQQLGLLLLGYGVSDAPGNWLLILCSVATGALGLSRKQGFHHAWRLQSEGIGRGSGALGRALLAPAVVPWGSGVSACWLRVALPVALALLLGWLAASSGHSRRSSVLVVLRQDGQQELLHLLGS